MNKPNESFTNNLMLSLWINWAIVILSYCTALLSTLLIIKLWQPLLIAFIAYMLYRSSYRANRAIRIPRCALIIRVAMHTLFWSSLIMAVINLMSIYHLFDSFFNWTAANDDIPYITGLVIFPMTVLVCLWQILNNFNTGFCRECQARNGYERGTGVVTAIYNREARYQVKLLLVLAFVTSASQWWYYEAYYINVNLNRPDQFFFIFLPVILYAFSLYIMKMHYNNLGSVIGPLSTAYGEDEPSVRIFATFNDQILLANNRGARMDTPSELKLFSDGKLLEVEVRAKVRELLNNDNFELRYLYSNKSLDMQGKIDHYIVALTECDDDNLFGGRWYSLKQIENLIRSAKVATELIDEIFRVFTITMTWKTYRRSGVRKYPVKEYHPQFRMSEVVNLKIDFNDLSWFDVANNNEDHLFFRLKHCWKRSAKQTS